MYSPLVVVYYPPLLSPEFLVLLEWANKWASSHGESHLRLSLDTSTRFVSTASLLILKTQDIGIPMLISTRKDLTVSFFYDCPMDKLSNLRSATESLLNSLVPPQSTTTLTICPVWSSTSTSETLAREKASVRSRW